MAGLTIRAMIAADLLEIERQASQAVQLGLSHAPSLDEAEALLDDGEAWTAVAEDGRIVACLGIRETFPGKQGVAWGVLSGAIGAAHLAITRFARQRIRDSRLVRIEALVRTPVNVDALLASHPDLDPYELLEVVVSAKGPEVTWAMLAGLKPAAVLRKFGAASEDHVLCERIA